MSICKTWFCLTQNHRSFIWSFSWIKMPFQPSSNSTTCPSTVPFFHELSQVFFEFVCTFTFYTTIAVNTPATWPQGQEKSSFFHLVWTLHICKCCSDRVFFLFWILFRPNDGPDDHKEEAAGSDKENTPPRSLLEDTFHCQSGFHILFLMALMFRPRSRRLRFGREGGPKIQFSLADWWCDSVPTVFPAFIQTNFVLLNFLPVFFLVLPRFSGRFKVLCVYENFEHGGRKTTQHHSAYLLSNIYTKFICLHWIIKRTKSMISVPCSSTDRTDWKWN